MKDQNSGSDSFQRWEQLYREALFEADIQRMPRRIELAKHAILDRLEDISCTKDDQSYRAGEMAALRNAHHALKTLEGIYLNETGGKMIA